MQPLNPNMGGRPGNTIDLRNQYGMYNREAQINGQSVMPWPQWLNTQGYTLGPDGHVIPMAPKTLPAQSGLLDDIQTAQISPQMLSLLG